MKVPEPRKLPSGNYFIQLRLNGVSVPVTAPTAKECKRTAELIKAEHRAEMREIAKSKSDLTLQEACERYIERKERAGRSPETIRGYDVIMRNRFQSVMGRKVASIKNWQDIYDNEAKSHSPKTMGNTWAFIKAACKSECGITLPEIETLAPKKKEHAFLSPEEITAFVKASEGDKCRIALLLALHSCRASEILAIDWKDVDFQNDRIKIRGAVVRDKHNQRVEKQENKTEGSARYIPIFIPELKAELQSVESKSGKVVQANQNTILRHSNEVCDNAGIPRVGVHGLRHSFASLAYSLNVPVKITMKIGGWDDYNTVMKIYTHLSKKDIGKYTDDFKNFFNNANEFTNEKENMLK